jgi:hypothetical protein
MIFEFYSKTELDEWDVRKVFSELQWGVIWKVVKEEVYSGWKIQVYYAILTKPISDRIWVDGWNVTKLK